MAQAATKETKQEDLTVESNFAEIRGYFAGKYGRPHYRNMTAEDFQSLDRSWDAYITLLVGAFADERYDLVDDMKPTKMSREEFMHVALREGQRRNVLETVLNKTGFVPRSEIDKDVTVRRPSGVDPEFQSIVTARAGDVAFYDAAIGTLISPMTASFVLQPEVAAQVGLPKGRTNEVILKNDTEVVILGYMVGANPNSFPGTNASMPAGKLPLSIGFAEQPQELIKPYCSALSNITKPGRDIDQTVALSAGIIMARTDAVNGKEKNIDLGFNGMACKDVPIDSWNDSMRIALSGFDRNTTAQR